MKNEIKYKNYACINREEYLTVRERLSVYLIKAGRKNIPNYGCIFNRFLNYLDKQNIPFNRFTLADMKKFSSASKRTCGSFRTIRSFLIKERYVITDENICHNSGTNRRFDFYLNKYLSARTREGLREQSIQTYKKILLKFAAFAECNHTKLLRVISRDVLEKYIQTLLAHTVKRTGCPQRMNGIREELFTLRSYFRYLVEEGYLVYNPAALVHVPKREKIIHSNYLKEEEMKQLMSCIDETQPLGLRTKILFMLSYACGLRVTEAVHVQAKDIQFETGMLRVRQAKGGRERSVPLGSALIPSLKKYLRQNRLEDSGYLFSHRHGKPLTIVAAQWTFRKYLKIAGLTKKISFHALRHSAAKHLLERGLGIRYVQKFLGHRSINSTAIYTKLTIENLKQAVREYHPRETDKHRFLDKTEFKSQ